MRITSIGAVQMSSDGLVLLDVSLDHAGVPDGIDLAWQPKHYLCGATVATVPSLPSWRRLNSPLRRLSSASARSGLVRWREPSPARHADPRHHRAPSRNSVSAASPRRWCSSSVMSGASPNLRGRRLTVTIADFRRSLTGSGASGSGLRFQR
jgi:hypothetical protein